MLAVLWMLPALITALVCLYIRLEITKHANLATGQRWKDRFAPALFLGVAISLTCYAVLVRVEGDIAPLQANRTVSSPLLGHRLFIHYPGLIRIDDTGINPPELVAWLERDANAAPLTVTVELSSNSSLVFTDETGALFAPLLTLTDEGALRLQRLGIRLLGERTDNPVLIEVIVRDATGQRVPQQPINLEIARETQAAFLWRVIKTRFFGDAGLGLAVASAVLGIGWQVLSERRQTRSAQQFERIREIRDLFNRDLVEWHIAAETLQQEARRSWEDQARSELKKMLEDQYNQLTNPTMKGRVTRLLHDAAEYYRASDSRRLRSVLLLVDSAHPEVFRDDSLLQNVYDMDQCSASAMLPICRRLLHYFHMDAHELAVAVMERLASSEDIKNTLFEAIRSPHDDHPGAAAMSRLATTDPRIRRLLVDHLPWVCDWSPCELSPAQVIRSHQVSDWLETNELKVNPFDAEELQSHREFVERITLPRNRQQTIIQTRLPIFGHQFDCRIAALALYNELRKSIGHCMPVLITLSDLDPATQSTMMHFIGHAVGKMWRAALSQQPGMLLWLPEDEQKLLAEWLVWISGSLPALRRHLRHEGLQSDVSGQIILRCLDELLPDTVSVAPTAGNILEWLTIRPPCIEQIRLIVIDDVGDERAGQFAGLMPDLHRAGICCSVFMAKRHTSGLKQSDSTELRWSEKELLDLLDNAVAVAGGPAQRLIDLTEPDEEFVIDILRYAQGSFARCL
ncbi:MAG: hypothetical protein ACUVWS_15160, partial [Roseiflexus sp.]